jgi:Fe-Mn family superoxide dismutase
MSHKMKPLSCDPARIRGMSEQLIIGHYENNYGGAVKRLNLIGEKLAELDYASAPGFMLNGLKREELIAMNSMILHEHSSWRRSIGLRSGSATTEFGREKLHAAPK